MAWPTIGTVTKTATNGGGWNHTDMNNLQYQFCRATGILNTDLDPTTVCAPLGLNEASTVRRGSFIQSGSSFEDRNNTAYGTMTTPDRVQNIVLPTDGLIDIYYHAEFKSSVGGAGRAAIFIGSDQLKVPSAGAPAVQEATSPATNSRTAPLTTTSAGLATGSNAADYTGPVTTGQLLAPTSTASNAGGVCTVFAAAGTYTISIQFKASSGTVSRRYGKLWVVARSF